MAALDSPSHSPSPYTSLLATYIPPPDTYSPQPLDNYSPQPLDAYSPLPPPSLPRLTAASILVDIEDVNERLCLYFNTILPTLAYRDARNQHWAFDRVEADDYAFCFLLADSRSRKRPVAFRPQLPFQSTPDAKLLGITLPRITIADGPEPHWSFVTPNMVDLVPGGYVLSSDGTEC
jgi:hypothetical protein